MKLNLKELENKAQWKGYKLFDFDYKTVADNTKKNPEWVHFGGGNIFRIFPAALCQRLLNEGLMNTGIVVGNSYDPEIIDILYKAQDNLTLGVTLKADGSISKEVIGSISLALNCDPALKDEWADFNRIFCSPSLKMVSFTITEKGYALFGPDGNLLPGYVEDFKQKPEDSKMFMCHLTRLLLARFNAGELPLTLVSMDNCSHNGEKLQSAILTIAENWAKKGFVSEEFLSYLKDDKKVAFPWSMIDKITPRPDAKVAEMLKKDGFEDTELLVTSRKTYISPFVNAEEPQYLVIEDKFPNGRPPLEKAGVYFTDRDTVNNVEKMKVCTCLNPLHTSLAVSGCLLGFNLICDEMKDPDLKKMVETLGYKEGLPVVINPGIIEPKAFIDEVITKRLPNPFMPDTPQRIATDTSQKLSIRFGETVKAYEARKMDLNSLKVLPLVFAMWARYLMAIDDNGNPFELSPDPLIPSVKPLVEGITLGTNDKAAAESKLKQLLSNEKIFGFNVASSPLYEKAKNYFLMMISGKGMVRKAIQEAIS